MVNGTQMTFEELMQPMYRRQTVTVSDFHVRLSVLLASEEALKIHEELYSLKSCGLLKPDTLKYCSQKMLQDSLTMRGGVTFQTIICAMAELGYSVEWQVCNSRYFGVPQHRERVFLVGHFGDGSFRKVFPVGAGNEQADELQGQQNSSGIVTNTLDTRIEADTRGTYPIVESGGGATLKVLKVNGYHKA